MDNLEVLEKLKKDPYGTIAKYWWKIDKNFLAEICLNAIFELTKEQEKEMIQEIIERNF